MDYLDQVARFTAEFPAADLPAEAVERTALIVADCIGAIVGGVAEAEMQAFVARPGIAAGGPSLLVGTGLTAQPAQAALVNGTAGTWLEMDEGNQFARGHPGMHTVPAALAFAEAADASASGQGGPTGRDFLAAVAIGYEVGARVGIASQLRPSMHPHGTWGAICAAVAVQRLAGADAARMREAMNLAANLCLGTSRRTMLEGGTVRNVFAGVSGQMGLMVHDMLETGFCGALDDVAHVFGRVASDSFDPEAMTEGLGTRWEVTRNYFKLHACCRYNHAALDALAAIAERHGRLDPGRIERIEVDSLLAGRRALRPMAAQRFGEQVLRAILTGDDHRERQQRRRELRRAEPDPPRDPRPRRPRDRARGPGDDRPATRPPAGACRPAAA